MSFEDLVERITPTLKYRAKRLNGCSSFFDDEDLFQEALLHLWIRYKNNELDDKNDNYILQSCVFHLKNYLRKNRDKAVVVSLDEPIDEDGTPLRETLADNSEGLKASLEDELLIESIKSNGLTKREQQVLTLSLEGFTVREVGRRLGISHVRVVQIKNRIRSKCERQFKEGLPK